jgi:hypothetical protein
VSFIGISVQLATASRAVTTEAPHWREGRRGKIPKRGFAAPSSPITNALFALESQSFLDHLIAHLPRSRSSNDRGSEGAKGRPL